MKLSVTYLGDNILQIQETNPQHPFTAGHQYLVETLPSRTDRNVGHHRKFWAMLRLFSDYLEHPMPDDLLKQWAVLGAGWYNLSPDGKPLAKSIAFESMPQAEFERLYSAALDYLLQAIAPENMTRADVELALTFA